MGGYKKEGREKGLSLHDCLTHYTSPELLEGENSFFCRRCYDDVGTTPAVKQLLLNGHCTLSLILSHSHSHTHYFLISILSLAPSSLVPHAITRLSLSFNSVFFTDLPPVFCLAIKRFSPYRKIENDVSIPSQVDFSSLLRNSPSPSPSPSPVSTTYRLYGCVVHSGGLGGGHYVSYTRSLSQHQGKEKGGGEEKWYYASDTSVSDVKANQVKVSQSYLVFYERECVIEG